MTIGDHGKSGPFDTDGSRIIGEPPREPVLRAPWPAAALAASFLALYGLQVLSGDPDATLVRFGFSPAALAMGHFGGLVTALFVHGSWTHAFLNAIAALAFGAPIARLFGARPAGVAAFFGFFLVCGAISSLGYAAVHWGAPSVLAGASGGVSGFMGAASRLIERRGQGFAPFTSRTVIGMAVAWVVVNLLIGSVGLGAVAGGAQIAWEAHIVGYAVGLLLVEPVARLLGWR